MTYIVDVVQYNTIPKHKPTMWGLQLTLVSKWQWLFNNQRPPEWMWSEGGMELGFKDHKEGVNWMWPLPT